MVYGVTPFGHMRNLPQKMIAIQNPLHKIDFPSQAVPKGRDGVEMPDHAVRIEADLLRVLKSCLRFESKRRSTIPQLLADSFLRREDSIPVKDGGMLLFRPCKLMSHCSLAIQMSFPYRWRWCRA